jgi:hypothetical protein
MVVLDSACAYASSAALWWFGDDIDGHGTHVSGSVGGAVLDSNGQLVIDAATGSAPFSRISFYDIAPPNSSYLSVPFPIDAKMLPVSLPPRQIWACIVKVCVRVAWVLSNANG